MDILLYCAISGGIIMFWHMAFNTSPNNFGLMQMIGIFILGGIMGHYMQSIETGLLMSIVLSLIFI
ncbi:MAG: hypothetical protein UZ22_OP11002000310 [Microgenomates bacterium OLB23]|nr:MAG: hypothetical protein UZ22_OP11002000310 [Microgenomates bacterium OLB23]